MLVDISGSRCISCAKYTQYYAQRLTRSGPELSAIDCGFCGQLQRTTRPGSRCKHYREASNVCLVDRKGGGTPCVKKKASEISTPS